MFYPRIQKLCLHVQVLCNQIRALVKGLSSLCLLVDFGKKLAMDLLTPHLYKRELTGVPQRIILKMYMATGDECFLRHVMKIGDPTQSVVKNLPYTHTEISP